MSSLHIDINKENAHQVSPHELDILLKHNNLPTQTQIKKIQNQFSHLIDNVISLQEKT
jgi:hypothetical protein